jgi:nitrogen regulatory protein PII-like uncharacterized protein
MKWLLIVLTGFFILDYSDARAEDWKLFSESEGSSFYLDGRSVSFPSENVARVLVKVVVSEKDRSAWVAKGGEKYLNLSYIKSSMEVNCKDKTERSLSLDLFSEQDILDSFKGEASKCSSIPPGSNWDNLYKAICK